MKEFRVTIGRKWSEEVTVTAKNSREAKKKAFDKFAAKKVRAKDHDIWVDEK